MTTTRYNDRFFSLFALIFVGFVAIFGGASTTIAQSGTSDAFSEGFDSTSTVGQSGFAQSSTFGAAVQSFNGSTLMMPPNTQSLTGESTPEKVDPNMVQDVRITGNNQIGAKDILKIIKTRQGRPFNEAALEEDKRALMQKGWFIDVKPKVERTPNGYIITFLFIERPILHYVKIVGNNAHTRTTLLEESGIKAGDALDPIAVHQAKEKMEQYYRENGYFHVHIEILSGDEIGDRGAVFLVSEGPKQRIRDVEFQGNQIASSARLKTLIQSKPGWFFWINSEFTRKNLDEDVETLTNYYRKLGFFYAKVDRVFVENEGYTGLGQNRGWVTVKFIIDEGPRCKIRDIRFAGQHVFSAEELKKTMKLPKETYFNQDMLESDMARIKEHYGNLGYVFAVTEPDPRIDEDQVDLVLNIKEGPRCYIDGITIEMVGPEGAPGSEAYTKWHTILNRSSLRAGEVLSTKEINATKRRLFASQLFVTNPSQGQIPDIIFNYPQSAIEDEEKSAAMADGATKIRGQYTVRQSDHPIRGSSTGVPGESGTIFSTGVVAAEIEKSKDEAMEQFANFFRLKWSENVVVESQNIPATGTYLVQPQNLRENLYENQHQNSYQYQNQRPHREPNQDQVPHPNSSQNIPVSNIPLSETKTSTPKVIYRGQAPVFVPPTQYSATPYSSAAHSQSQIISSQISNSPNTTQYMPPMPQANTPYSTTSTPPANSFQYPFAAQNNGAGTSGTVLMAANQSIIAPPPYNPSAYLGNNSVLQNNSISGNSNPSAREIQMANTPLPANTPTNAILPTKPVILGSSQEAIYGYDPNDPTGLRSKLYPVTPIIKVQETRTGQLMVSVAVSSDSGLMGRFVLEEQNFDILNLPKGWRLQDWKNAFRGKGQRFRLEAMPGTQVQRYSASWDTPYLFNLDYSFGVSGFYYQRYYDEWYENRVGGNMSFGKLWTPDFSTRLSLGAQGVEIYRPINPTPADLRKVVGHNAMYTIGLDATHNTRDSEFMPTEGHMISAGIEQAFGTHQFLRGSIDARKYFMLRERPDRSGRWVLGLRSNLGVSEGNTPIYERYFGGGFSNLRGFEFRGVSPRDNNGIVIGGCMEFYNSAELVFPITADDMIRGCAFLDTGTVESSISKWENNYRVAAGFGLRLTIPMMGPAPIALDFAFPISQGRGDQTQIFSFSMSMMR
ncbi:MAG: POTRA domain-containing protein [Thermoguttaceae bacterium]